MTLELELANKILDYLIDGEAPDKNMADKKMIKQAAKALKNKNVKPEPDLIHWAVERIKSMDSTTFAKSKTAQALSYWLSNTGLKKLVELREKKANEYRNEIMAGIKNADLAEAIWGDGVTVSTNSGHLDVTVVNSVSPVVFQSNVLPRKLDTKSHRAVNKFTSTLAKNGKFCRGHEECCADVASFGTKSNSTISVEEEQKKRIEAANDCRKLKRKILDDPSYQDPRIRKMMKEIIEEKIEQLGGVMGYEGVRFALESLCDQKHESSSNE